MLTEAVCVFSRREGGRVEKGRGAMQKRNTGICKLAASVTSAQRQTKAGTALSLVIAMKSFDLKYEIVFTPCLSAAIKMCPAYSQMLMLRSEALRSMRHRSHLANSWLLAVRRSLEPKLYPLVYPLASLQVHHLAIRAADGCAKHV